MSDFNPYAAPESEMEDPAAEPGRWMVSGGRLRFRDGARLPEIDLYSGERGEHLIPASFEFSAISRGVATMVRWGWLPLLVVGILFGDELGPGWADGITWPVLGMGLAMVWSIAARIVLTRRMKRARLHWHVEAATDKRRRLWMSWANRGLFGALGLMLFSILTDRHAWFSAVLLIFMVACIAQTLAQRRVMQLRCSGERDGWFELKGVPEATLSALGRLQVDAARVAMEGRVRRRRVYRFHLHRCSLRVLAGTAIWNPLVLLTLVVMKLTRSRLFERLNFAHSEVEEVPAPGWDPGLRQRWDKIQEMDALRGWRLLHVRQLDSPMGDLVTQWLTLVAPEDDQCLTLAVARLANARASKDILETTLRAWTASGEVIFTSNLWLQKPHPEAYRFHRVGGGLSKVLEAHRTRTAGLELSSAGFPEGWETRLDADVAARHASLEAVGIYGEIHEQEFPEKP